MVTVNDRPLLHVGDPCKIAITGLRSIPTAR